MAISDLRDVERRFHGKKDCSIAILTGTVSGMIAFDIDGEVQKHFDKMIERRTTIIVKGETRDHKLGRLAYCVITAHVSDRADDILSVTIPSQCEEVLLLLSLDLSIMRKVKYS
jgi:hypothetical protein